MKRVKRTKAQNEYVHGYRSGLEDKIAEQLVEAKVELKYETEKIKYVIPESSHTYTPDFKLPNGIFVESKGRFMLDDQRKHLLIKEQHPELDIRFVFQNSKNKIRKGSKTTYADWCNKHGFIYADKLIPQSWIDEK